MSATDARIDELSPARDVIRVSDTDTVAVALREMKAGERLTLYGLEIQLITDIPAFHKIALKAHAKGEPITRFGNVFASASTDIRQGEHVHTHNAQTTLADKLSYSFAPCAPSFHPATQSYSFQGYRRSNGRVGTRNEIWIIPTVGCVANVCEKIAERANAEKPAGIDAIISLPHVYGCSQLGDDLGATRQVLASLINHPNAGGVVLVGLGCENNQAKALLAETAPDKADRIVTIIAQDAADEIEDGLAAVKRVSDIASQDERTPCALSDLVIGLKCGGSDALSGLTANPLLGDMANIITDNDGGAILTEIPEIFGAEHVLMQRAASKDVFENIVEMVNRFKDYFEDHGQPIHANPSPGNKAGGITTLEEKSLGAVQKAGRAIVTSVKSYGQQAEPKGLTLLEAPGNDAVSSTALAAAGATLILFTTGRGTPLGFPVPTVKVSSNTALSERKPNWIDYDAGRVLAATDRAKVADNFLAYLLDVASGTPTNNEKNNERSIAIWKRGVTL